MILRESLAQTLWRQDCYLCSQTTVSKHLLCHSCEGQIAWVRPQGAGGSQSPQNSVFASDPLCDPFCKFCQRCGAENFASPQNHQYGEGQGAWGTQDFCPSCCQTLKQLQFQSDFQITENYPITYYQGLLAELLQWYKFEKELPLAKLFSSMLQRVYHSQFSGYFLVPVPPRAARLKQEAWDQVDYLCGVLAKHYRLPVLKLLQRNTTKQQKYLSREQRIESVYSSGRYSLALAAQRLVWRQYRRLGPLRLLLFDDVYTTGATVDMCRRALLPLEQEGWISNVNSMTLCLVP